MTTTRRLGRFFRPIEHGELTPCYQWVVSETEGLYAEELTT